MTARSPLAPRSQPRLPALSGVRLAVCETGIKYKNRPDLMVALLDPGTTIAGVLTRSRTRSAPVDLCAENLKTGSARAIIVNAGNANAFTGRHGIKTVATTVKAAAKAFDCKPDEVFVASTGVIGEPLDPGAIVGAFAALGAEAGPGRWRDAAAAIMTTDTFPKSATATAKIGSRTVTINGIAKGSGMIAPDMATMLSFIFTDAALPPGILQKLLSRAAATSFNAITVDSDTSTSDTVLLCATGARKDRLQNLRSPGDARLKSFTKALNQVMRELAHLVVRDGEGAEKLISITVKGAASEPAARRIGMAIANSPLVKTAIAGEDANWGRIVMAVGKSGEEANRDKLSIWIGGQRVARGGMADPKYREAQITKHMRSREIDIIVDVGVGKSSFTVWTCDLTHRYIEINADYRS
ncbi:MAG: bifunctional glutamate N-acetyltransferase/amino-acid acetyltransferase ArgJ [Rhizobiales bacterium]|nr:bifunctional glutamate N-acetyltransferase/amino-acid acetyltransferase ArgJ [Hyphomicrobiales bacterium]